MYIYADSISNLAKSGAGITASSSNPYFPVANICGNPLACKTWRSLTQNAATETLSIDLGGTVTGAQYPSGLDLLADYWNANATCSSVTWAVFNGASMGSSGTVSLLGSAGGPGWINIPSAALGAGQTSLLLTFNRTASTTSYIEVGKLLLGARLDTASVGMNQGGFTRTFGEIKNNALAVLGQDYSEKVATYWQGALTIAFSTEAVETQLRALFAANGTYNPWWVTILPGDTSTSEFGFPRYVKAVTMPSEKSVFYIGGGGPAIWSLSLSLKKQL